MSGFQYDKNGPYIIVAANDDRDYSIDWTALMATSPVETPMTFSFTVPTGLTAGVNSLVGNVSTQWISSPTPGTYTVTGTVVTNQGREFNRSFRMIVLLTM